MLNQGTAKVGIEASLKIRTNTSFQFGDLCALRGIRRKCL